MALAATRVADARNRDPAAPFLGVAHSVRGLAWRERLAPERAALATALAQSHELPELVGRVLAARGCELEIIQTWLAPTLRTLLPDPSTLRDMDVAAQRFAAAIARGETVAVFGDYDVDGAASTALMARYLSVHGLDCLTYIPDRLTEGYGPNAKALEGLVAQGAALIVTVDCGTMSHEALAHAAGLGADVIVLDHHQPGDALPQAIAVVNPNRHDDLSGQGHLAAAGVVFLFLVAVTRALRTAGHYGSTPEPDLMSLLDLVALATVCDVVPLTGLNRAYVTQGLAVMAGRVNPGLRALADLARLSGPPTPYHLGYMLGPRINAGGRIGTSSLGAELLASDDEDRARAIAQQLEALNEARKGEEARTTEHALMLADAALAADPECPVLVLAHRDWHQGLVGLVAGRMVEKYRRPAIAIALRDDGTGTGSARSVPGADIGSSVRAAAEAGVLVKGGGHAMAAGLTVKEDRIDALATYLGDALRDAVKLARADAHLSVDGALMAGGATPDLMRHLERCGPYGAGNARPRFVFPAHEIVAPRWVGARHLRFQLGGADGSRLDAIAFRSLDTPLGDLLADAAGRPLHVAGHLNRDTWGGRERIELIVDDAKAFSGKVETGFPSENA